MVIYIFEAFSWNFYNAQEIDIDYIRSLKMNYFDLLESMRQISHQKIKIYALLSVKSYARDNS